MIGGAGEKKTLRLVARYADACNLFGGDRDVVAHKLEVLKGHCEAENRDYGSIEKTIIFGRNPLDDVDALPRRDGCDGEARHRKGLGLEQSPGPAGLGERGLRDDRLAPGGTRVVERGVLAARWSDETHQSGLSGDA